LENEKMMMIFQPALSESLDAIPDWQAIVFHGFAYIGNCETYYLITHQGIYYCTEERVGFMKKRYVPQFFDLDPVVQLQVDSRPDRGSTYLRFLSDDEMLLSMWFKDHLSVFRFDVG
jgi:hypothetical protein